MPGSPLSDSEGVLRVSLKSNGQPVADSVALVSVQVRRAVNSIPRARVELADGDMLSSAWPLADGVLFAPGATLGIFAGYGDKEQPIFEGSVTKLGIRIGGDKHTRLVIDCCHPAAKMTTLRNSDHYADQTDSAVVASLLQAHALTAEVDATKETHAGLTQCDCSDWDFMVARAARNGLLVIADDDKLRVQAPRTAAEAVLKVGYGSDLLEFEADADPQIRGRMKFQGSAAARVGAMLEVEGVGTRFGGKVFVSAVEHTLADGQWWTDVEFGLPPALKSGLGGVTPAPAAGLQVGVVTQLGGDPAGEQRIRVRLPLLQGANDTVWARLLQVQASDGFGAFFLPEVGDDVAVAYFDNDPSNPVVLGSLYSSRRKPPHALQAPNDIKAWVTRCGHRLEFDDKDKRVTLSTPANNQVVLSDKDQSVVLRDQRGNQVELHRAGVSIDTPGDLRLTAQGAITLDAGGALNISAAADVKLAGLNVVCDAQLGFSAKGIASAELSAAGQTTVKGAMVMIN